MIQNKTQKNITGVVEDPKIKKDYVGIETDTAKVYVNPSTKEISVEVNTSALLDWDGSDPNKGYPSVLGNDALLRADSAYLAVKEETNRSLTAENQLDQKIDRTASQISVGDGKVMFALEAEQTRAISAESQLLDKILNNQHRQEIIEQDVINEFNKVYTTIDNTSQIIESHIRQVEDNLFDEIDTQVSTINNTIDSLSTELIDTYASKLYVQEQILNNNKLSKQLADSVDLDNNTVTVGGIIVAPREGYIYLLKDASVKGQDIYQEYTLINKQLVLIGDTSTSLEGYATEDYVGKEIDNLRAVVDTKSDQNHKHNLTDVVDYEAPDLSPYATIVELQSVEEQIRNDLTTYVDVSRPTKVSQLENDKGYLTEHQSLDNYYNKEQTSALVKDAVDSIEIPEVDLTPYATQQFVIDKIEEIPPVDLSPYAKKEDIPKVDSFISEIPKEYVTESELDSVLRSINFIDGGTSATFFN